MKIISTSKLRRSLEKLPPGADSGLSREKALDLLDLIDVDSDRLLRECGMTIFLLESIKNIRNLPVKDISEAWPHCPKKRACHEGGCYRCWHAAAFAAGKKALEQSKKPDPEPVNG